MYFTGDIALIRVYDKLLTAEQVTKLYSDGVSSTTDRQCGGIETFDFNEDCLIDINDLSLVWEYWLTNGKITLE